MKKKKIVALLNSMHAYDRNVYRVRIIQQAAGSSGAEAGQTQTGDNSLFNEPGQLPIVNEARDSDGVCTCKSGRQLGR